jgi:hypothetical protein
MQGASPQTNGFLTSPLNPIPPAQTNCLCGGSVLRILRHFSEGRGRTKGRQAKNPEECGELGREGAVG